MISNILDEGTKSYSMMTGTVYGGKEVRTRYRVGPAVHLKHFHSGGRDYPARGR